MMLSTRGRLRRSLLALAAGLAFICPAAPAVSGDRPLEKPLEVRVMQFGFGGLSGTLYRIEPDGAFVARQIVAGEEDAVLKSGRLELGHMIAIAEAVYAAELETLSRELAAYEGVNPSVIEVRYGELARTLSLPPGYQLESGCAGVVEGAACRILELSRTASEKVENQ